MYILTDLIILTTLISGDGKILSTDDLDRIALLLTNKWKEVRLEKNLSPAAAYDEMLNTYPGKIPKGHDLGFFANGLADWPLLGRGGNKYIGKGPGPEDSVAEEV